MNSKTRDAARARDLGVLRIRKTTRLIGVAAVAGSVIAAAGFAHALPTHLPQIDNGRAGSGIDTGGGGGSNGSSNGGGLQGPNTAPGGGSGPSHVTSGGS